RRGGALLGVRALRRSVRRAGQAHRADGARRRAPHHDHECRQPQPYTLRLRVGGLLRLDTPRRRPGQREELAGGAAAVGLAHRGTRDPRDLGRGRRSDPRNPAGVVGRRCPLPPPLGRARPRRPGDVRGGEGMKIVQAVGWYFPESLGGTEVYVAGLCRRLLAAGQEVLVAAPDAAHDHERTYEHDGVPVYRYPIPSAATRGEAQGLVTVRGAERFHAWLASQRPDLVHVHSFVTGLGLAEIRAAKLAGARVIATTHAATLGWVCQRG